MKRRMSFFLLIVFLMVSLNLVLAGSAYSLHPEKDEYDKYRSVLEPLPAIPPIPAYNSITPEKIKLGKMPCLQVRIKTATLVSELDAEEVEPPYFFDYRFL